MEEGMLLRGRGVKTEMMRSIGGDGASVWRADDEDDSEWWWWWGGREWGKKKSRILDRSNMAGSHGYFSFTLVCIHTWFQKHPSPKEAFQRALFANFSNLVTPSRCISSRCNKGPPPCAVASGVVIARMRGKHVRHCRPFDASLSDHTVKR